MNEFNPYSLEPFWDTWYIDSLISEGSFGTVYKIYREEFGTKYYSALKIISIPKTSSEEKQVFYEGMDEKSANHYFREIGESIYKEVAIMAELKGKTNIVSYEDHKIIQKENGVGFHILIRMELLENLNDYILNHNFTNVDVVNLGKDLCKALILCQKRNLIHRDIKPANIFVSSDGDYKLGDFGIARQLEGAQDGLSIKGTYRYMAPEVYLGNVYDERVDIYSLGMVLYYYLNDKKSPFSSTASTIQKYSDRQESLKKRFSGEKLPAPKLASEQLSEIILKACEYDPQNRYQTAEDFLAALEALSNSDLEENLSIIELNDENTNTISEEGTITSWFASNFDYNSQHDIPVASEGRTWSLLGAEAPSTLEDDEKTLCLDNASEAALLIEKPNDFELQKPEEFRLQKPEDLGLQKPEDLGLLKPDDLGLQKHDDIGLQKPDDLGLQKSYDFGLQKPDDIGLQKHDDIGLLKHDDIGLQKPDDFGSQKPVDTGIQKSDEIGLQKPVEIGLQKPDDYGTQKSYDFGAQNLGNITPVKRSGRKIFVAVAALLLITTGIIYLFVIKKPVQEDPQTDDTGNSASYDPSTAEENQPVEDQSDDEGETVKVADYILELDNRKLENCTSIDNIEKLTSLSIAFNKLSSLKELKDSVWLEYLNVQGNKISELKALSKMEHLTCLNAMDNQISDISPISNLKSLEILILSNNRISSVDDITHLKSLIELRIDGNKDIKDISVISHLKNLKTLTISGTGIKDITSLYELKNLTWLDLSNTNIPIKQINKFKSKVPNCEIIQ